MQNLNARFPTWFFVKMLFYKRNANSDRVAFSLRLKNAEKLFLYALRHNCGVEALAQFGGHFVKFVALVDFDGLVRRI